MIENQATHIAAASGAFSPQRNNNFTIEFYGIPGADTLSLSLQKGFLPDISFEELAIPFGNEEAYAAGRRKLSAGSISFRDYVDKDIQGIIANWVAKIYPGILNQNDGRIMQPSSYKRDANIIIWAPDGTSLRLWKLVGCWPVEYKSSEGGLSQEGKEQVVIGLSIRYDKFVYLGRGDNFESDVTSGIGGVLSGV